MKPLPEKNPSKTNLTTTSTGSTLVFRACRWMVLPGEWWKPHNQSHYSHMATHDGFPATYEALAVQALRETLKRPYGYLEEDASGTGLPDSSLYSGRHSFDSYDPSLPVHPIFNPKPAPEPTLAGYLEHREREERKSSRAYGNRLSP